MWSPVTHIPPPLSASFISPPPKWLDSDDDFEHEPALISDDAVSSSCSRAPSLAPLDSEDPHIDIVSSPVQDTFFRAFSSSRAAPLSRYNKPHPSNHAKPSTTREDVAAALLALRAQPRLSSSRPVLPTTVAQPVAEMHHLPPVRRSRVVSPSLRNLVLPRTPSPPPRAPLPMTNSPPIENGHKITPSAHTAPPPPRRTPASSPLPPSSPFAEEDEYEGSASTRFHSPSSSPKAEHLEVHFPPDNSDTDGCASSMSRDGEPQGDNDDTHLITHELISTSSLAPSLVSESTPDERPPVRERHHSAPLMPHRSDTCAPLPSLTESPADSSSASVLDPTSVPSAPLTPLTAPPAAPVDECEQSQSHGSLPRVSVSPTPALPASAQPMDNADLIPDTTDSEYAVPVLAAASDPDSDLCEDDLDEHCTESSPLSSPHHVHPTSSPLSSPPSSPSLDHQHQRRSLSPSPAPRASGTKRPSPEETDDRDPDFDADSSASPASPPACAAPARARSKRRRRDANADDKPWRDRKKHTSPAPPNTTTSTTSPPPPSASPSSDCPHPALLGLLLETLALSRASSLTQSALVRTNAALAPESDSSASVVLATTLEWAVRARVLGCVRSSGEALPPSYFYDPTEDPDRERGELLRCLMPRAGKRRETKKYKQYYWAPVVVGRGRTRTWDVDWEE